MKLSPTPSWAAIALLLALLSGCKLIPETRLRDQVHNPFPQLKRVAVLPFFNQSDEPTLDTRLVTNQYYAALQSVPGFEVMPVGVTKNQWMQYSMRFGEPRTGEQFQQLAKQMGVEAIVVGSVTDFDSYYPPRMAMTVHWYAANEGFHPIPAGYGLPWGTKQEQQIPKRIAREAEFELARSQLSTQTPLASQEVLPIGGQQATGKVAPTSGQLDLSQGVQINNSLRPVPGQIALNSPTGTDRPGTDQPGTDRPAPPVSVDDTIVTTNPFDDPFGDAMVGSSTVVGSGVDEVGEFVQIDAPMPEQWPSPTDLIPDPPSTERPTLMVNRKPILSHTRLYRGDDIYFTNRLADYVETGDDARPGGWQGYLKRSDDFVRFCCHLHITEMLESRGGSDQSDLILRWPLSRY